MNLDSKIFVAGHNGLIGSSIVRKLLKLGYSNILTRDKSQVNLISQEQVRELFVSECPEYVFLAAASVGSVENNSILRGEFLYNNLQIESNVINQAYHTHVKKLLFLGSSSIYSLNSPQPLKEEYLMDGMFEYSTEPDSIAKMTGIKLCEYYRNQYGCNFISAVPTNVYGINDHYSLDRANVIPSLIRKMHEAKINGLSDVEIWGVCSTRREFLFVDDLADALFFLMLNYNEEGPINLGVGKDISIQDLAFIIKDIVGYKGGFVFDNSKPIGMKSKLLNIAKIQSLGWESNIDLVKGIEVSYQDFLSRNN